MVMISVSQINVTKFCLKLRRSQNQPLINPVLSMSDSTGFGNAFAMRLDAMGFTVFAGCLNPESEGAKRLKEEASGQIHVLKMDINSDADVKSVLDYVNETHKSSGCGKFSLL